LVQFPVLNPVLPTVTVANSNEFAYLKDWEKEGVSRHPPAEFD
jgi:hypothetical protein